jgi:hypothetical protein
VPRVFQGEPPGLYPAGWRRVVWLQGLESAAVGRSQDILKRLEIYRVPAHRGAEAAPDAASREGDGRAGLRLLDSISLIARVAPDQPEKNAGSHLSRKSSRSAPFPRQAVAGRLLGCWFNPADD